MKPIDLLDSIGNIDDDIIIKSEKKHKTKKAIFIIVDVAAACLVICSAILVIKYPFWTETSTPDIPEPSNEVIEAPTAYDINIYYVSGNKLDTISQFVEIEPNAIFEAWKKANNIGSEVKLLDYKEEHQIEDSDYEYSGVVTHNIGEITVTLTISKNIEKYYNGTDSELLFESLKNTMSDNWINTEYIIITK